MQFIIYALIDPRNDHIKYVGMTSNLAVRFVLHLGCQGRNTAKNAWITDLLSHNHMPIMKTLEIVEDKRTAIQRERYWITKHLDQGATLTNFLGNPLQAKTESTNHFPNHLKGKSHRQCSECGEVMNIANAKRLTCSDKCRMRRKRRLGE